MKKKANDISPLNISLTALAKGSFGFLTDSV